MLLLTPGSSAPPGCCRRCLTIGFRDSRPTPGAASLLAGRTAITGEVRLHQHWVPEDCSGHKRLQTGFSVEGGAVAGRVSCFLPGIHQGLLGAGASASDVGRGPSRTSCAFLLRPISHRMEVGHSGCSCMAAALVSCP